MESSSGIHLIILFLLLLIAANLMLLDVKVFGPNSNPVLLSDVAVTAVPSQIPTVIPTQIISQPTTLPRRSFSEGGPILREYYIPLGTGTTSQSSWEDLISTETLIDPSLYGTIKEAYFIASLRNPTQNGNIEAQLYNITDGHPVWNSDVVLSGPVSRTITSGKITLSAGSKIYRVRLKSTLSYQSFLDNAKIRIIAY